MTPIEFEAKTDRELLIIAVQQLNELAKDFVSVCDRVGILEKTDKEQTMKLNELSGMQIGCRAEIKAHLEEAKKTGEVKQPNTLVETLVKYGLTLGIAIGAGIVSALTTVKTIPPSLPIP